MKVITLIGPEGKREVPVGKPYALKPGEVRLPGTKQVTTEEEKAMQEAGILLGDAVEAAIKLMPAAIRPKHCTACERRKRGLNYFHELVREHGIVEAARRLRAVKNDQSGS